VTDTKFQDYISPENWKTLNALDGEKPDRMPFTDELAGETLETRFGRAVWTLKLVDAPTLCLYEGELPARTHRYKARAVLDDVTLVEFQRADRAEQAVTLVVDAGRSIATAVVSTCRGDTRHVSEEVLQGVLPGGDPADRHEATTELVGHRALYTSGTSVYEHVYLNSSNYTWHCVTGPEKGQAATEFCQAFKIRDRVYLFTWIERVVPCDGVVVLDWVNLRLNGRIFGWDTAAEEYNMIRVGAGVLPLNVTSYEQAFRRGVE